MNFFESLETFNYEFIRKIENLEYAIQDYMSEYSLYYFIERNDFFSFLITKPKYINLVKLFIENGIDLNYFYDNTENTILHLAACRGNAGMLSLLIKSGAKVNVFNTKKRLPIHYATNEKILKVLIDAGSDVNAVDIKGYSPINLYGYYKQCKYSRCKGIVVKNMLRELVNAGAKLNNEVITHMFYKKYMSPIKYLISINININTKDEFNFSIFQIASIFNQNAAKLLLKNGAEYSKLNYAGHTHSLRIIRFINLELTKRNAILRFLFIKNNLPESLYKYIYKFLNY